MASSLIIVINLKLINTVMNVYQSKLKSSYAIYFHVHPNKLKICLCDGCETWSLTLREEHRLSVFENRVLRRIFGPKRDEVTGGWEKTA
jgi:hypothetical protein